MSMWISAAPAKFGIALLVVGVATAALTCILLWHWVRRALDVPRVPRPAAMYGVLALLWAALGASTVAGLVAGFLLRDHQRLTGPADLAVLRCQPIAPGRLRMEVLPLGQRRATAPEQYDLAGDACAASIVELDLHPAFGALGIPALARLDAVGPVARPRINPAWLTPGAGRRPDLTAVAVRKSRVVQVVVPPDPGRRFVMSAAPGQEASLREAPASAAERMAEIGSGVTGSSPPQNNP